MTDFISAFQINLIKNSYLIGHLKRVFGRIFSIGEHEYKSPNTGLDQAPM